MSARAERARVILTAVDAWNDPPAERLEVIAELFALGEQATREGYIAEAQSFAYEAQERLKAHKHMVLSVERKPACPVCGATAGYHDKGSWFCLEHNRELVEREEIG